MRFIKILRGTRRGMRHFKAGEKLEVGVDLTRGLAVDLVSADRAEWLKPRSRVKPNAAQTPPPLETRGGGGKARKSSARGSRKTSGSKKG